MYGLYIYIRYNNNYYIILPRFLTITRLIYALQNLPSVDPTAQDYTESSRTMSSATLSGTVGEERLADTNVLRVWLTTANPGCACGPTKYRNAKSKVSILYTRYTIQCILYSILVKRVQINYTQ